MKLEIVLAESIGLIFERNFVDHDAVSSLENYIYNQINAVAM